MRGESLPGGPGGRQPDFKDLQPVEALPEFMVKDLFLEVPVGRRDHPEIDSVGRFPPTR